MWCWAVCHRARSGELPLQTPLTTLFPLSHIFSPSSQRVKRNYFEAIYQTPCHPPWTLKSLTLAPLTLAVVGYYQTPVSLMCKTSTFPDWWRWMMWWFQVSLIAQYSGITQCIQCVHHPLFLSFPQVAALKKFIERSFFNPFNIQLPVWSHTELEKPDLSDLGHEMLLVFRDIC